MQINFLKKANRNPLVAPFVSTKVSDISKQIASPFSKQQAKNSTCQDGTTLQTYSKEEVHSVSSCYQMSEPLDTQHEIFAVCSDKCMGKAEVYNWLSKYKISMTSLHDADSPEQAPKVGNPANTQDVGALIQGNHYISITDIAAKLSLVMALCSVSFMTIWHIRKCL